MEIYSGDLRTVEFGVKRETVSVVFGLHGAGNHVAALLRQLNDYQVRF